MLHWVAGHPCLFDGFCIIGFSELLDPSLLSSTMMALWVVSQVCRARPQMACCSMSCLSFRADLINVTDATSDPITDARFEGCGEPDPDPDPDPPDDDDNCDLAATAILWSHFEQQLALHSFDLNCSTHHMHHDQLPRLFVTIATHPLPRGAGSCAKKCTCHIAGQSWGGLRGSGHPTLLRRTCFAEIMVAAVIRGVEVGSLSPSLLEGASTMHCSFPS